MSGSLRLIIRSVALLIVQVAWAVGSAAAQTSGASGANHKPLEDHIWSHVNYEPGPKGKPVVDFKAIDNWLSLAPFGAVAISPDGKYFAYVINRGVGFFKKRDSVIVQSVTGSWRRAFPKGKLGFFSGDGKQYILENNGGLCFVRLGAAHSCIDDVKAHSKSVGREVEWLVYQTKADTSAVILRKLAGNQDKRFEGVSSYAFHPAGRWLVLQRSGAEKELLLHDLRTGAERHYQGVVQYLLSANGDALLLTTQSGATTTLRYASLTDASEPRTIWSTTDTAIVMKAPTFDASGKQVVFTLQHPTSGDLSVWFYNAGTAAAVEKINEKTPGIDADVLLAEGATLTADGRYIQFPLQERADSRKPDPKAVGVTIWSYRDTVLQSAQAEAGAQPKSYPAYFSLGTNRVINVRRKHEKQIAQAGDYVVIATDGSARVGDRFWEKADSLDSAWVVSLRDGSRKLLPGAVTDNHSSMAFSPSGKYLVYFDETNDSFHSYDVSTGSIKDISVGMSSSIEDAQGRKGRPWGRGLGWRSGRDELLVFDNYDIWVLDASGKKRAESLTNGYGARNKIVLTKLNERRDFLEWDKIVEPGSMILTAYDPATKNTGFFRTSGPGRDPERLSMGPYLIQDVGDPNFLDEGMKPVKARDANTWILKRQSEKEEGNYCVTNDFKSFNQVTHIEQHSKYNWYTTELHTFKKLDGETVQGLLYKPENFDPSRKYPVIVVFYGKFSDMLHRFNAPFYAVDGVSHALQPGWFVSHGYVVFTPDIDELGPGHGASAFKILEGAAIYLSDLPYVDSKRIGASAHSWSGKLGMYLLTHSKRYAAIAISEGFLYGNLINVALSLAGNSGGESHLEGVEKGFEFGNLWENKERWLDHTSVLNADRVSTPLLLFNNKSNEPILQRLRKEYPNQTLQIFTALRRLEKPVWWLQYDKGGHNLYDIDEARDFTVRYTQFFDHFLKGAPAPLWMTHGLPYNLNKIEDRLELDREGR